LLNIREVFYRVHAACSYMCVDILICSRC